MGGGKSNSGSNTYDYFGMIAGVIGVGPIDEFMALIVNGKAVWPAADPWADGVYREPSVSRSRTGNIATVRLTNPHRLIVGDKVTVEFCSDTSFNVTTVSVSAVQDEYSFSYSATGSNVSLTGDTDMRVTKGIHYTPGVIAIFANRGWKALITAYSEPTNAPGLTADWEIYSVKRDGSNPDYIDLTTAHGDVDYGPFRVYWGSDTQTADSELNLNEFGDIHPPYIGMAYVRLGTSTIGFWFGREIDTPPNTKVIVSRTPTPIPATAWVTATAYTAGQYVSKTGSNWLCNSGHTSSALNEPGVGAQWDELAEFDDHCANPSTLMYEVMTNDIWGFGIPNVSIQAALELASYFASTPFYSFLAPLMDRKVSLREILDMMAIAADLFVRFDHQTASAALGAWIHGTIDPSGLASVTYQDLVDGDLPQFDPGSLESIVTEQTLTFRDRQYAYAESAVVQPSLRAMRLTGGNSQPQSSTVNGIVRRNQANWWASETLKRISRPLLTGTVILRRASWEAKDVEEGGYFLMDIDPEPAGYALYATCRCLSVEVKDDAVTIKFEQEVAPAPIAYAPADGQEHAAVSPEPPPVQMERIFALPPLLGGGDDRLCALVSRPSKQVAYCQVDYDNTPVGDFPLLATLNGFGVRGYLHAGYPTADDWAAGASFTAATDYTVFYSRTYLANTTHTATNDNLPGASTAIAVTADNTTDKLTATAHGLTDTQVILLGGTTAPTGLTIGARYFVKSATTNDFKLALTSGGTAINFTTDGTFVTVTQDFWDEQTMQFALWDMDELYTFQSGFSDADQRDATMMVVVLNRTSGGAILFDSDGHPELEIFSLGSVTATGATSTGYDRLNTVYALNVSRERFGTTRQDFTAADPFLPDASEPGATTRYAEAWLILQTDVFPLIHKDFPVAALANGTAYFKLHPATRQTVRTTDDGVVVYSWDGTPEFTPRIAWTLPAYPDPVAVAGAPLPASVDFEAMVTDSDANLVGVTIVSRDSSSAVDFTEFSDSFTATSERSVKASVSLPTAGDWYVTLKATDDKGNVTESQRVVRVAAASGPSQYAPPENIRPPLGDHYALDYPLMADPAANLTDGATPATDSAVYYAITSKSVGTAPAFGSFTALPPGGLGVYSTSRVWLLTHKAAGAADSAAIHCDFTAQRFGIVTRQS